MMIPKSLRCLRVTKNKVFVYFLTMLSDGLHNKCHRILFVFTKCWFKFGDYFVNFILFLLQLTAVVTDSAMALCNSC